MIMSRIAILLLLHNSDHCSHRSSKVHLIRASRVYFTNTLTAWYHQTNQWVLCMCPQSVNSPAPVRNRHPLRILASLQIWRACPLLVRKLTSNERCLTANEQLWWISGRRIKSTSNWLKTSLLIRIRMARLINDYLIIDNIVIEIEFVIKFSIIKYARIR